MRADPRAGQFARFSLAGSSGPAAQFFDDQAGVPADCSFDDLAELLGSAPGE